MPIIKSAIKQLRKNIKNRAANRERVDLTKKQIKVVTGKITAKDNKDLKVETQKAIGLIDKLAKKNLIAKNTAARRKSHLMKKVNVALAAK